MNTAVNSLPLRTAATAGTGLTAWFSQAGATVWRALEALGRARAQSHLIEFANRCEAQQPELAREIRAAVGQGPLS